MTKIRVTSVKVFRTTKEKVKEICEKRGEIEIEKMANKLELNLEANELMEKKELEAYRSRFKSEPNLKVLLTYEEVENS